MHPFTKASINLAPEWPGLYALHDDGILGPQVLYIGSTANLRARLADHLGGRGTSEAARATSFSYEVVPFGDLAAVEQRAIDSYKARHHGARPPGNQRDADSLQAALDLLLPRLDPVARLLADLSAGPSGSDRR